MASSKCENCGIVFDHRRDRSPRTCSLDCRREVDIREHICKVCGIVFYRKKSITPDCCSKKCSMKLRGPINFRQPDKHIIKPCPTCGKMIDTLKSWERIFCSMECRRKLITKECPQCHQEFSYLASWPKMFCGRKCYADSRRKEGTRDYGPRWHIHRAEAIARDKGCSVCGEIENLHVHHIKSARSFGNDWTAMNKLDNLITLCRVHHLEVHGGVGK